MTNTNTPQAQVLTGIDSARAFLVEYMNANFVDKTFNRYINDRLAGDFAYEMARALLSTQPAQADTKDAITDTDRMNFLHRTNKDDSGFEYGVCRVRFASTFAAPECYWTASDHSDIDALIRKERAAIKGMQQEKAE